MDKIYQVVLELQQTMESDAKTQITQYLNASIDHLAKRLFQLVLFVFVLMLVYRLLMKGRNRAESKT